MATELDALVVSLRADTRRFRRDIAEAQAALAELETLAEAPRTAFSETLAEMLGSTERVTGLTRESFANLELALRRFADSGKLGFRELRETALDALADIAAAIFELPPIDLGGGGGSLPGVILNAASSLLGRAAGGPVSAEQAVVVGERGPELFVPRTAGEVLPNRPGTAGGNVQPITVTVNVNAAQSEGTARQSGTQVALAVRRALARADRFS